MTEPGQINVTSSQFEVIKSMEGFVAENIGSLLKPIDELWQPTDFLPDLTAEDWQEQLIEFRRRAVDLPDELLVVLIGDMITEEALPGYQTWLNRLQGLADSSGMSLSPWARWSRGWTAEENRHGDLLNKYLYLTGRVDMRAIEKTIHHLIADGFDAQTGDNPYRGFIYAAFQERATKISHSNVGVLAVKLGEDRLHKICGLIAGDEARHEKAYKLYMGRVFEIDPKGGVMAFAQMMKNKIVMPAHLMSDGKDKDLFTKFSTVAQVMGVYTARDYAAIIDTLVKEWKVSTLQGLSGDFAKAQEYLCGLSARYMKLAERIKFSGAEKFSWIFDREIAFASAIPAKRAAIAAI